MKSTRVWQQKLYWVCPVCGFTISDQDILEIVERYSEEEKRNMDFMVCSGCGEESGMC